MHFYTISYNILKVSVDDTSKDIPEIKGQFVDHKRWYFKSIITKDHVNTRDIDQSGTHNKTDYLVENFDNCDFEINAAIDVSFGDIFT